MCNITIQLFNACITLATTDYYFKRPLYKILKISSFIFFHPKIKYVKEINCYNEIYEFLMTMSLYSHKKKNHLRFHISLKLVPLIIH